MYIIVLPQVSVFCELHIDLCICLNHGVVIGAEMK